MTVPNGTKKVIRNILIVMGLLSIILTAEKWYWAYWPFDPAMVYSITVTNPNKQVCAGTDLTYVVDIDKKMNVPVTVKRVLVNSVETVLKSSTPSFRGMGRMKVSINVPIGQFHERGDGFMRWTAEYEIGPNKRIISRHMNSDTYRVVGCDDEKRGPRGITGKVGPAGKEGKTGGFSIFGGKEGKQGKQGKPGKDCVGKDCK